MTKMNIDDIVKGGQIVAEEEVVNVSAAVSDEEYKELRQLQGAQTLLNANGYQLVQLVKQTQDQIDEVVANGTAQIAQATEKRAEIDAELKEVTQKLQKLFAEITTKYGMAGVSSVNISETSPHYITAADLPGTKA